MKRTRCTLLFALLSCVFSLSANAASGRADYDLDDDGLIEINDLADLNDIRNSLDGTKLYGVSTGCPTAGCKGFELTADLNFDTNGDGKLDATDTYWNAGKGWVPIGVSASFTATFEGNGHVIRNLMMNTGATAGLFGSVSGGGIRNIGLGGKLTSITGTSYVGGLVGSASNITMIGVFVSGNITATGSYVGGLVGNGGGNIQNAFSVATITGGTYLGGLIGWGSGTLANAYAVGKINTTGSSVGGIIGIFGAATNTYWAADTTGQTSIGSAVSASASAAATLAQLKCPTAANNTTCLTGKTLYENWDTQKDTAGNAYWNFGTAEQLPGLVLNGVTYRDSDGDGYLDGDDAYPANFAAALDSDADGFPDNFTPSCDTACQTASGLTLDHLPNNAAASLDADLDGKPDAWNVSCNAACQTASTLVLDTKLYDADNDGVLDTADTDINNDSLPDADIDHNGLIEVSTLAQLDAMRNNLIGTGRTLAANGATDSSGCPAVIVKGAYQRSCKGYELTTDLNFDTNADGKLDASDTYWNAGAGWNPIGQASYPAYTGFFGVFEGNGHIIRNLMINRPTTNEIGLFGRLSAGSRINQLAIAGPLVSVTGASYVGVVAGMANSSQITAVAAMGKVRGTGNNAGGVLGYSSASSMDTLFSSVDVVSSGEAAGGIVGYVTSASTLKNVLAVGRVNASGRSAGGIVSNNASTYLTSSYWATDSSTQPTELSTNAVGAKLSELQCPTIPDNTSCVSGKTLYAGWSIKGVSYWNFGTNKQLPALVLNGITYRDSDGDGALDADDAFPSNYAASLDKDADGAPDTWTPGCNTVCQTSSTLVLDLFPTHIAASLDGDGDGKPDAWNAACNSACQTASGLVLDTQLNDADNDGILDAADTDSNGDNILDADSDHNGLIEVGTLAQLDAMRNNLAGEGRKLTANGALDSSGCPLRLVDGVATRLCYGYELTTDLNFDTNADGKLDAADTYWNTGKGWVAIGNTSNGEAAFFTGTFDGNGHIIRNLMINLPSSDSGSYSQGLFASTQKASLRNLGLGGNLLSIQGYYNVGGLVGSAIETQIEGCFVVGAISGYEYVGGIVGYATKGTRLRATFSAGSVSSDYRDIGGLVGFASSDVSSAVTITGSYTTSKLNLNASYAYPWVGGYNEQTLIDNYYSTDSGNTQGAYYDRSEGKSGATIAQLKCPVMADDAICLPGKTLYANWGTYLNAKGAAYWNFGTINQLPGLVLNGITYRDGDGDGVLDADDAFPDNIAASADVDKDGIADRWNDGCDSTCQTGSGLKLDQFPNSIAVSADADLDGLPDAWNSLCNSVCQTASGLILDAKPNDTDNDGISNLVDKDDNNDGLDDADSNSNGLIEVSTWAQLNAMRNNLAGTGRTTIDGGNTDSSGCPAGVINGTLQAVCAGYELTADLNFDTNNDGKLNASDTYWNAGAGWSPISGFTGTFDGNSHVIKNLMVNTPNNTNVGLFGYTKGATLRNIGLTGKLMSITGRYNAGGLVGEMAGGSITAAYASGAVNALDSSNGNAGGLVGSAYQGATIIGSYTTGSVTALGVYVGGLVGYAESGIIKASFSTASVKGADYVGGIAGYGSDTSMLEVYATGYVSTKGSTKGGLAGNVGSIENSYWALDATGQGYNQVLSGAVAASLAQLRCPTAANNASCAAELVLYKTWNTVKSAQGTGYWDFGTNTQLPGLVLNGVIHRDSDGDGVMDADDIWPNNYAAALDADADGAPDRWTAGCDSACQTASGLTLDQFPTKAAASVDTDLDGLPDAWNASCNSACQTASGLVLDSNPNDSDNDGIANSVDKDDNADGIEDADANSNGLIDIKTLAELDAVRYNLKGDSQVLTADGTPDSSGCPISLQDGVLKAACNGYELVADLNFDTNGDGKLDATDTYWNAGKGWLALSSGNSDGSSSITLEGNGHVILNLMINRPNEINQGLFGYLSYSEIRNLGLAGALTSITGDEYVGGIVGYIDHSRITGSYVMGAIKATDTGSSYVGGLVGQMSEGSSIKASFSNGSVESTGYYVGGIVGYSSGSNLLEAVFSTATIKGYYYLGGLVGYGSQLTINASYATGKITAASTSNVGGLAGYADTITNSYWATDATGQTNGGGVGATLVQLQCPTAASNTSCKAGTTLYEGWADIKDESGNTYWNFGTASQLPTLVLINGVMRDSDNDGLLDAEDPDDDNDGVLDAADKLPTNAAASVDTDGDGYPDSWNAACNTACQTASGLKLDQLPANKAASIDSDGDGFPDSWNSSCNAACQVASGLKLDNLPSLAAASVDADGDGLPDAWNTACNTACQTAAGVALDKYLGDTDNDGVPDTLDTNNSKDNGKPTITAVPADISLAATGETTQVTLAIASVIAVDAVDAAPRVEVSLNGTVLGLDANNQVSLPSGALQLQWVAIDKAGNRSAAMAQVVNIYPQARFTWAGSASGEKSTAKLGLSFSGAVPVYPVTITFTWVSSESTAVLADVDTTAQTGVDMTKLKVTINSAEELATAALAIPVLADSLVENDETLVFDIATATAGKDAGFSLPIVSDKKRTTLTITEKNLAPEVALTMVQGGKTTTVVDPKAGNVTVTAAVTDLNGKDTHSYVWTTTGLPVTGTNQKTYSFDPFKLADGNYSLSVKVTDNGVPPLSSDEVKLDFTVVAPVASSSSISSKSSSSAGANSSTGNSSSAAANSSSKSSASSGANSSTAVSSSSSGTTETPAKSGGGGGGSASWLLLLLLAGLGFLPKRTRA